MMGIQRCRYRIVCSAQFTAVRTLDEVLSGSLFTARLTLSSEALDHGVVVSRDAVRKLISSFNHVDLTQAMHPAVPTSENLARFIGQIILDWLFRLELDKSVRLEAVRVRDEMPDEYAEIVYEYAEEE